MPGLFLRINRMNKEKNRIKLQTLIKKYYKVVNKKIKLIDIKLVR
jgi:hypothetical protein